MSRTFNIYDFNLSAGGTQIILAEGTYFRIQSATGPVNATIEGFGTLNGILVGQGIKDTKYSKIILKDVSGAPNSGSIICASQEFIDNRTYGVMTISNTSGAFANSQKTVTNASAQLLASNANRRYLLIQNNDTAGGDIFVRVDSIAATLNTGIKIPAGAAFEWQGYTPTGAVFAIGSTASNANIVTVEG